MPHIHEKIDFTVDIYIVFNKRVLLRKHDKYEEWFPVGGHIELDEDPNEAAIRESWEEAGLKIKLIGPKHETRKSDQYKELVPPTFMNRHDINEGHEHISLTYIAVSENDEVNPQEKGDISNEFKWLTHDEAQSDPELKEEVRFYSMKAIEIAGESN